jgi:hypothetical protein
MILQHRAYALRVHQLAWAADVTSCFAPREEREDEEEGGEGGAKARGGGGER